MKHATKKQNNKRHPLFGRVESSNRIPIGRPFGEIGRRLLAALRGRVTGLAWPTYVLDIPGGHGKVPLGPAYLEEDDQVRDPAGGLHRLARPATSV